MSTENGFTRATGSHRTGSFGLAAVLAESYHATAMRFIRGDNLNGCFTALLETHTRVDIATAWATGGEHLRVLSEAASREQWPVEVRAIVGLAGNATRPDALEELYRITNGDLRIIRGGCRLFHPKLYLFQRQTNGCAGSHAWVGSANFTKAGFGRRNEASNEELIVQMGPGETTNELVKWFQERWDQCPTDPPVRDVIDQYTEDWNPPGRSLRRIAWGEVSRRIDLLGDAHRPLTLEGYREVLKQCEGMLQDEQADWKVFGFQDPSYMRSIHERRRVLLGERRWSDLDHESETRLKGADLWGLMGRVVMPWQWKALVQHESTIRTSLGTVVKGNESEFPDVAVDAFKELMSIKHVGDATATLLLTIARPDRLSSVNSKSKEGLATLSRIRALKPSKTCKPQDYRDLLLWLYSQPWYAAPPANERSPIDNLGISRCPS